MFLRNILPLLALTVLLNACSSSDKTNSKILPPAEPGHHIKVKIDGYDQDILTLANYYGEKQYVQDTARLGADGYFTFQGDTSLLAGVYMMVMAPDNSFLQAVISKREQRFTLETSKDDLVLGMKVSNGPENEAYFDYLKFLNSQIKKRTSFNAELEAVNDSIEQIPIREKLVALNDGVKDYQKKLADQFNGSLLSRMMMADIVTETPEFKGDDKGVKAFYFNRAHYFDNIDVSDEGLLRSPILANKVKIYMKNYIVQNPDSIITAVDMILAKAKTTDNFKYFLIDFLNNYASSKVVGMDAVYVDIVNKYYSIGLAHWTDPEQLEKILDNAKTLEPILIGKPAPDLVLQTSDKKTVTISGIESDYTVLMFWDPECSHCEKSMPDMNAFYKKYKPKGVELLAICTVIGNDDEKMKECGAKLKKLETPQWINATDQYHRSKFKTIYDIKSTPRLFILDKDKKIIMKSIGADQLSDVMDQIMKDDKVEKVG